MFQSNVLNTSYTLNKLQGLVNVLIVQTPGAEAEQLEKDLTANGIKVKSVNGVDEARIELNADNYDALLLNICVQNGNTSIVNSIRDIRLQCHNLPIVILADEDDKAIALESLKSGGQDWLLKDKVKSSSIVRCLRYAIERQRIRYEILLEGERSTRLILENSLQAFLAMDRNGTVLDWNLRAEGLFGWARHEAIGKSIKDLIRPTPTRDVYLDNLDKILSDSPEGILNKRIEVYAIHKDGHQFPIEFGFFRIKDKSDYLYCTFINDISERKRVERRTKQLNEELERLVQERTSALLRSNKELQQLVKIASHDLQEPLRAIQGFAQLLSRRYYDKLDKDGNQFIEFILDGTQRMQRLIQSVLEHSNICTEEREIESVDVSTVIKEVMKNLNKSISDSKATIVFGDLPSIPVERSQLIQLFQNLISNSIKYAGNKVPYIVISAEKSVDDWLFSVQDNGIGIDNKYVDKIFDMFARLHGRIEYSGTGMGLAICKKIVTANGGKIWTESEPGEGSIFFFTLPSGKTKTCNLSD